MKEIVRGKWFYEDQYATPEWDADTVEIPDGTPVLILPIEDGKCGPFEKWMVDYLKESATDDEEQGLLLNASSCREIATAISRLFEEVER